MTDDHSSITIDVLANDSDEKGDTLTINSASAQQGSITITADNTLLYTPLLGFDGMDIIDYTIDDGNNNQASTQMSVTIKAYEIVTVNDTAKGGSMGLTLIGLVGLVLLRLRRTSQQAKGALAKVITLMLCVTLTACSSPDDDAAVLVVAEKAVVEELVLEVGSVATSSARPAVFVDTDSSTALPQQDNATTSIEMQLPNASLPETAILKIKLPETMLPVDTLALNTKTAVSPTLTAPSDSEDDTPVFEVSADDTVTASVTETVIESVIPAVTVQATVKAPQAVSEIEPLPQLYRACHSCGKASQRDDRCQLRG
jgi:MYXO-CTERM domain-containing protein